MKDENGNNQRDKHGNLLHQLRPHPDELPDRWLHVPHKTGLPTSITVGKLIDDYGEALQKDPNKPGWRQFKRIAKRERLLNCLIHQAKLRYF